MWLNVMGTISFILLALPVVIAIYSMAMNSVLKVKERKYQMREKYKHLDDE